MNDLKVDFVMVVVFSELCTLCRKALPTYGRLFDRINEDHDLSAKVKVIGMGVESTKRAVARFRKEHEVAFPLFADERGEIFGALGEPRLPVVYLLRREMDQGRILLIHHGALENIQQFRDRVSALISQDQL